MGRALMSVLLVLLLGLSANAMAEDDPVSDLTGDLCPNGNVIAGIIDQMCWSCLLPIRLAGVGGDKPSGSASDRPMCMCLDEGGVPELGMPVGFYQPSRLISFSATPYCMPSFGARLSDDNSRAGRATTPGSLEKTESSFFHYKYWTYPLMAMINMFVNNDCSYDQLSTMDLAFFSEADPLYQDDMLAFLLAPESIIFANPVATALCTADCAATIAGNEIEEMYFCAGCSGNLYPLTGHVITNDDPVRTTSLLTTRVMATLHRRGNALLTMGNHMTTGECKPKYAPMLPKTQYRVSMLFPVPEAAGNVSGLEGAGDTSATDQSGDAQAAPSSFPTVGRCCHKFGESVMKWGLGRNVPGKEHFVYLLYRWNDCCLR
ncbi:TraU family protein [uncultured Photobacterium sp.]|uniref:TraU family protein n=1 Tax=uncultured Photobacterium sp. TaxID=173973 RepID=UPI002620ACB9|nr:TraU family protein [uncultured Photobacterium sp.]